MNILEFKNNIDYILNQEKVESIKINNTNIFKSLFADKLFLNNMYNYFIKNYNNTFGNDDSMFFTKINDFIYRINLLVNNCLIEKYKIDYIKDIYAIISNFTNNKNISLFDAVNYNYNDDLEIIDEFNSELDELLLNKKI